MSAEPSADFSTHIIPQGILENSIKITNESHTGERERGNINTNDGRVFFLNKECWQIFIKH